MKNFFSIILLLTFVTLGLGSEEESKESKKYTESQLLDNIGLEKKVILEKYGTPNQVHEYSDNDYYWIVYYDMFVDEYGKDRNISFYFKYGRGDSMKDKCYTVKK